MALPLVEILSSHRHPFAPHDRLILGCTPPAAPTTITMEGAPLADVTPNGTSPNGTAASSTSDAEAEAAVGGEGGAAEAAALAEVLPKLTERFAAALVQQLLEKIDRMRE
eukprot:5179162-Prymnesium_polylepis.1